MEEQTPREPRKHYLTSAETIALLGIRAQTLYAYVSKGLIRSVKQSGTKQRLYLVDDIQRVQARSAARAGHGAVAGAALQFGEPVVATAITEITPDGPCYRGRLAVDIAHAGGSFETASELLWTGLWHDNVSWNRKLLSPATARSIAPVLTIPAGNGELAEILAMAVLKLGLTRGTVEERITGGQTLEAAREIICTMTACFGLIGPRKKFLRSTRELTAQRLLEAVGAPGDDDSVRALQALLVLFADHELSPSTFIARVAAAAGASLHSCVAAALCGAAGVELARMYDRIESFLYSASSRPALMRRASALHEQGQGVPGFGHPLYPQGDKRAVALLQIGRARSGANKRLKMIFDFIDQVSGELGLHPRHELAAITITQSLGMPRNCAGALFMVARTAGWVAHVQEQRRSGQLIRPRAKFVAATAL